MSSPSFFKISSPHDGVLLVEMNRPPVNAFNETFWKQLQAVFNQASKDPAVRAVVLASALPKLFTAGLDLKETDILKDAGDMDPARRALLLREHILEFQAAISSIEKCIKPVIAAAHGLCLGLAIDILCAADVRYAAASARFSIKKVNEGRPPKMETLPRCPKMAGKRRPEQKGPLTTKKFPQKKQPKEGLARKAAGKRTPNKARQPPPEPTPKLMPPKPPMPATETNKIWRKPKNNPEVPRTPHVLTLMAPGSIDESLSYTATWNQGMLQSLDTPLAIQSAVSRKPVSFKPLPKL
ncbi:hypothetical protein M408DRAFT_77039 [Serendipita vermifera MAFF 305830]|uniref:Enoyl-CoA hydratase n=1 Tax=Serendipita vermifera MAFF 305830 TaxID=933852 RepID=A0A0C2WBC9_SERVB|nr:hypothetical protein M408DRAFT_77039 [Serendipita vermifera MAFF 305830]